MLKNRIRDYWENRAENFLDLSFAEMNNEKIDLWKKILTTAIGTEHRLKVLDVGTGAGYVALVLASMGHDVTGIDLSPKMVAAAAELAARMKLRCDFLVADAEKSGLPDQGFDVIISRNLTWTLPNIAGAYRDWYRILRQGGRLLIFDADYGDKNFGVNSLRARHGQDAQLSKGHANVTFAQLQECDAIKNNLDISKHRRPSWDVLLLADCGFSEVNINFDLIEQAADP
ncbi:class I SAM-dependent methyltransferase, partial [Sporomusa sp.]|uniref:class I SAM-dependent methyltransferase n=1 Tax=Sporomusa sp. TaxID=2078658 RepID=UPI002CDAA664